MKDDSNDPLLPFLARQDLEICVLNFRDEESAVIKDPIRLKYFRLTPEQHLVLMLLNVPRSIDFLKRELQKNFPSIHVEVVEVQALLQDLHQQGLIISCRLGQGFRLVLKRSEEFRKEALKVAANPLFIRLPGWDPNALLGRLVRYFGWLLHPVMILLSLVFVSICVGFAASHYDEIRRRLPQFNDFFSGENIVYLWLTLAVTKLIHEFGHGMACRKLGGECREMGLILLVFSPTMFCNTSDSWRFENRWHRMAVGAAGMYYELILASIAVIVWWNVPAGALQNMCLNVFFVSAISTVIFNANPLLKFDGYYILSDFLEIPNMQAKGTQALRSAIAWGCFGIKIPQSAFLPRSNRGLFVTYAVLAALYRWVVMIGIIGFMYTILRPYHLEMMGIAMASFSLSANFLRQGKQWYGIFAAPRKEPMSKKRISFSIVLLIAGAAAIVVIPVPWYIEAPCYAQPSRSVDVYATVPGILDNIGVKPGDQVEQGQLLFSLANDELLDRVEVLIVELDAAQKQKDVARSVEDDAGVRQAVEREKSLRHELSEARSWLAQSSVSAPCAGRIVEPALLVQHAHDERQRLTKWEGTPLSQLNRGAFIETRAHLCTIAPTSDYEVVMLVDQEDAKHVTPGKTVRIKIYGIPSKVIVTRIDDVAERAVLECPPELSANYGGAIAAQPGPGGQLTLERGMIQASAPIDLAEHQLRSGFRGSARIVVEEYSIGSWLLRWIVTKIWFRL